MLIAAAGLKVSDGKINLEYFRVDPEMQYNIFEQK